MSPSAALSACRLTGKLPGPDGRCPEHRVTACVVAVHVAPPLFECVIPGFWCMDRHDIAPVEWGPIEPR